jgi:cytochrome oxidase Cu insertion factor (SCO1/SenC/PrrC family)
MATLRLQLRARLCRVGATAALASTNERFDASKRALATAKRILLTFAVVLGTAADAQPTRDSSLILSQTLTFTDADGRVVRTSDFPGQWLLVYFGYTHCADLCPTGLSVMVNALEQIGAAAAHIQPLFVTVDPERDKGPILRSFAEAFDRRLIGLGGSSGDIRHAADALGISFQVVLQGDNNYVIDHSSNYTFIEPSRTRAHVLRMAETQLLAAKLIEVMTAAGAPLDNVNNLGAYR